LLDNHGRRATGYLLLVAALSRFGSSGPAPQARLLVALINVPLPASDTRDKIHRTCSATIMEAPRKA
jgi:hypothetical protein